MGSNPTVPTTSQLRYSEELHKAVDLGSSPRGPTTSNFKNRYMNLKVKNSFSPVKSLLITGCIFIGLACTLEIIFDLSSYKTSKFHIGDSIILTNGNIATILEKPRNNYFYIRNESYYDLSQGYGIWKNKYEYVQLSNIFCRNYGTVPNPVVR